MSGGNGDQRPIVDSRTAENLTGEVLEYVRIYLVSPEVPKGFLEVKRSELLGIDLGGLAIAWKDADGNHHRMVGAPLEAVFSVSRILRPAG